ncbi:MAG: hypothetical protein A2W99_16535 [Bacteroidetes bacterium GWF2_33_16]|nr:MAG: hypothetical protein A2X00_14260 [Bacteroidetes bacterium GWE2_32_14]OFY03357.1 MAG: hypothetical protein A2W99_16535 [Bacteroidetes bacterium GWF2_33_16]
MKRILLVSLISISIFAACKTAIIKTQTIEIKDFDATGYILDIGGGGEGVIGQLKTNQVIAIDLYKSELESAPDGPFLKIVMDATDLKFLDNTFENATIFYTMMYIPAEKHEKVFSELYRTLKPGTLLRIWDVNLPARTDNPNKKSIMYPFRFKLPTKSIRTAYGVRLAKNEIQNADYYTRIAEKAGFKVANMINQDQSFYLELQKYPLLPIPSIIDTLRQIIDKEGIKVAINAYQQLKQNRPNDFVFTRKGLEKLCTNLYVDGKIKESLEIAILIIKDFNLDEETTNSYGIEYLNDGKVNEAIEILQLNTLKFPQSANTFNSLGNAYIKSGNKILAIKNFEEALKLDPQNQVANQMLEQLKSGN